MEQYVPETAVHSRWSIDQWVWEDVALYFNEANGAIDVF